MIECTWHNHSKVTRLLPSWTVFLLPFIKSRWKRQPLTPSLPFEIWLSCPPPGPRAALRVLWGAVCPLALGELWGWPPLTQHWEQCVQRNDSWLESFPSPCHSALLRPNTIPLYQALPWGIRRLYRRLCVLSGFSKCILGNPVVLLFGLSSGNLLVKFITFKCGTRWCLQLAVTFFIFLTTKLCFILKNLT